MPADPHTLARVRARLLAAAALAGCAAPTLSRVASSPPGDRGASLAKTTKVAPADVAEPPADEGAAVGLTTGDGGTHPHRRRRPSQADAGAVRDAGRRREIPWVMNSTQPPIPWTEAPGDDSDGTGGGER